MGSDPGRRIAVLISGRGSNLQALIDAIADGRLRGRDRGRDLEQGGRVRTAAGAGRRHRDADGQSPRLPDAATPLKRSSSANSAPATCRSSASPASCGCSGARFSTPFPTRILNIHPSLLPSFPGVDAQRQAWEHGAKVAGATVHFVTGELDGGPIVLQAAVPILERRHPRDARGADPRSRSTGSIPKRWTVLDGGWTIDGRRFTESVRSKQIRLDGSRQRVTGSSVSTATSGGQLMRTGT